MSQTVSAITIRVMTSVQLRQNLPMLSRTISLSFDIIGSFFFITQTSVSAPVSQHTAFAVPRVTIDEANIMFFC